MKYNLSKTVVMSLGGSIIFPSEKPDVDFLKKFRKLIIDEIKRTKRQFVIVVGGGRLCRLMNETAEAVTKVKPVDKDWLGIRVIRLNAELLRVIFSDVVDPVIIENHDDFKKVKKPVTIGAAWQPGHSSDYDAVVFAKILGVKEVINASKPKHVFDKDPSKYPGAKPFESLTWKDYMKLIPAKWTPGANVPFDPVASRMASENNISTIILNGNNLENFKNLFQSKNFEGTIIS